MQKTFLSIFFLLIAAAVYGQNFKLSGKVANSRMEPLSFASVQLKGQPYGVLTQSDGSFEFVLEKGSYELIVTMVGFKNQVIPLVMDRDYHQNIILEEDARSLDEVVVKAKVKDRAEEIMQNLIRNKEAILSAPGAYSSKIYIKAVQQDSGFFAKNKGKGKTTDRTNNDLTGMAMTELFLKLDYESDNRLKEERVGVLKTGNAKNLFYQSVTEGSFNFYHNLLELPSISPTPFLSPISYSGLVAYRFKTLQIERRGKHKIYTISVKPRQLTNATVEGELTVSDSAWAMLHCRFRFPSYHLQEYEFFEVEQDFNYVQNKAWMLTKQQFTYYSKSGRGKLSGQTTVTYGDYELNKIFPKKHFGVELSATREQAYKQDSTFWGTARKEPLTEKEIRLIRYRDSIYRVTNSERYLDSLDHEINRITWKKLGFFGQSIYNRKKESYWHFPSAVSLYQPVAFGGGRINVTVSHSKTYESRKNIFVFTNLSYGVRNNDVNGSITFQRLYNTFNRGVYGFSAGKEFQFIYQGDAWINMLKRNNVYLNNYVSLNHGIELFNGVSVFTDIDVALRRSVSAYKTGDLVDSVLGDFLKENRAVAFKPYNALYGNLKVQYTPFQRYTREPKEKIILGSKWPSFYVLWRKGVKDILSSEVDFDFIEFGAQQIVNLGLLGQSKYSIKTGEFINRKDLRLIDYQFQRRGDPFLFMNPHKAFQSLDSTFAVFNRYWEAHYVHEFNGLFLNKIPLLKKLQLREIGGGGFLFAQERNLRYAELFAGIERAFQSPFNPLDKFKIGVYIVGSAANQFQNPVQFKVGFTTWDKRRNKWF
jgi:hypothetical protein